ncbi:MAG: hypothetical protein FJ014_11160 [Chloroflexi bacterium]|nr:hypothetical protein [Chloroflexota bacterium]
MAQMALHTLVGTALTDPRFCHDLLNGRRPALLTKFDLTNEEREVVLGVKAESIQDFAAQLGEWLKGRESLVPYPAAAVAVPYSPLRSPVRPVFWQ